MYIVNSETSFRTHPVKLAEMLGNIHSGTTVLPNFQRKWVWEPERVRELIISVAYHYPAGSLLTMPIASKTFDLRPFQGAPETTNTRSLMVLDGQQRLTSLYQALYRREGVEYKTSVYTFYLDVNHLMSDPDGKIEEGEPLFDTALYFVKQEKDGRRYRYEGLRRTYELTNTEDEVIAGALPLGLIFEADGALTDWRDKYLGKIVQNEENKYEKHLELLNRWDALVKSWLSRIRQYEFPVVEISSSVPLGAICHIFEKVNSQGVPLDVFELCTAILWAQGFYLNVEWDNTRKALTEGSYLKMQPLAGTPFLQSLSLLESITRKRANTDPATRVAVTCRKKDLMALDKAGVEKHWGLVVEGYEEASRFMMDQGIVHERVLPYSTMIVPLAAIFSDLLHRKGQVATKAAWPKIVKWYWCSVFGQRYSSQIEFASAVDFEQVVRWVEEGSPEPDAVRTFTFRADILQEVSSIRNVIYKGILSLLVRDGARDFGGGGKLTTDLFYETAQDHHHIFPTKAAEALKIKDARINTIVNKSLISASSNKSIGGRKPSVYLKTLQDKLGEEVQLDGILNTHFVDAEILASDNWDAFMRDRRKKLCVLIEKTCGGVIQPFSDTEAALEIEEDENEEDYPQVAG